MLCGGKRSPRDLNLRPGLKDQELTSRVVLLFVCVFFGGNAILAVPFFFFVLLVWGKTPFYRYIEHMNDLVLANPRGKQPFSLVLQGCFGWIFASQGNGITGTVCLDLVLKFL